VRFRHADFLLLVLVFAAAFMAFRAGFLQSAL
jgi:hypothetical protein